MRLSLSTRKGYKPTEGPIKREVPEGVQQEVMVVDYPDNYAQQAAEKERLLLEHLQNVLNDRRYNKIMILVYEREFCDYLAMRLWEYNFQVASLHGGKSQESRLWNWSQFSSRNGQLRVLVVTDAIGRGTEVEAIAGQASHVVVFEMGSMDDYVVRMGRITGKRRKPHILTFFEYWRKEPSVASELVELLTGSKLPVPEDLKRIADEVSRGQREASAKRSPSHSSVNSGGRSRSDSSAGGSVPRLKSAARSPSSSRSRSSAPARRTGCSRASSRGQRCRTRGVAGISTSLRTRRAPGRRQSGRHSSGGRRSSSHRSNAAKRPAKRQAASRSPQNRTRPRKKLRGRSRPSGRTATTGQVRSKNTSEAGTGAWNSLWIRPVSSDVGVRGRAKVSNAPSKTKRSRDQAIPPVNAMQADSPKTPGSEAPAPALGASAPPSAGGEAKAAPAPAAAVPASAPPPPPPTTPPMAAAAPPPPPSPNPPLSETSTQADGAASLAAAQRQAAAQQQAVAQQLEAIEAARQQLAEERKRIAEERSEAANSIAAERAKVAQERSEANRQIAVDRAQNAKERAVLEVRTSRLAEAEERLKVREAETKAELETRQVSLERREVGAAKSEGSLKEFARRLEEERRHHHEALTRERGEMEVERRQHDNKVAEQRGSLGEELLRQRREAEALLAADLARQRQLVERQIAEERASAVSQMSRERALLDAQHNELEERRLDLQEKEGSFEQRKRGLDQSAANLLQREAKVGPILAENEALRAEIEGLRELGQETLRLRAELERERRARQLAEERARPAKERHEVEAELPSLRCEPPPAAPGQAGHAGLAGREPAWRWRWEEEDKPESPHEMSDSDSGIGRHDDGSLDPLHLFGEKAALCGERPPLPHLHEAPPQIVRQKPADGRGVVQAPTMPPPPPPPPGAPSSRARTPPPPPPSPRGSH